MPASPFEYANIFLATAGVADGNEGGWIYFKTAASGTLGNTAAISGDSLVLLKDSSNITFNQWGGTSHNVVLKPTTPSAARTITLRMQPARCTEPVGTPPQLGGNLDLDSKAITGTGHLEPVAGTTYTPPLVLAPTLRQMLLLRFAEGSNRYRSRWLCQENAACYVWWGYSCRT